MENKSMRFLSLLLALVMVLGMFPVGHAHAEAVVDGNTINMTVGETYTFDDVVGDYSNLTDEKGIVNVDANFEGQMTERVAALDTDGIDSGAKYILVNTRLWKALENTTSGNNRLFCRETVANAPVWIVTSKGDNNYTVQTEGGAYMIIRANGQTGTVADEQVLEITKVEGTDTFVLKQNGQYLCDFNNNNGNAAIDAGGYGAYDDGGNKWWFYKVSDAQAYSWTLANDGNAVSTIVPQKQYVVENTLTGKLLSNKWNDKGNGGNGTGAFLKQENSKNSFTSLNVWNVAATETDGIYRVTDANGLYLRVDGGRADVTSNVTDIIITQNSTHAGKWQIGQKRGTNQYLNSWGGAGSSVGGYSDINDINSQWNIYEVIPTRLGTSDVTIEAAKVGTTDITIGGITYHIVVTGATVDPDPSQPVDPDPSQPVDPDPSLPEEPEVCEHKNTVLKNAKPATLTEEGYTGDTYCNDCATTIATGEKIPVVQPMNAKIGETVYALADSEFVYTADQKLFHAVYENQGLYLNISGTSGAKPISATSGDVITVATVDESTGAVTLQCVGNQTRYLHYYSEKVSGKYGWDRCSSDAANVHASGKHQVFLYKAVDKFDAESAVPGYTKVTTLEEGGRYLIVGVDKDGGMFVMRPTTSSNTGDYIAQLVTEAVNHTHNYTENVTTAATCAANGVMTHSCCGRSYTTVIPATGAHSWDDATCTAPKTCSVCGATNGSALGHTEEKVPGKDATCTENGLTEGKKCSVCGTWIIPQEEIPATHGNLIHVDRKYATCTAAGNLEYWYCFDCGKYWLNQDLTQETTKDAVVEAALGHYYMVTGVFSPDCTNYGYTSYECMDCGNTIVGSYVEKLGHTEGEPVRENETKPTLNSEGYYESVVYCSVCNVELSRTPVTVDPLTGAVAEIKGYKYATLQDAFDAVKDMEAITLLADVELDTYVNVNTEGLIALNLNGHSIERPYEIGSGNTGIVAIYVNGDKTALDIYGEGSITAELAVWAASGTVVIEGGEYHGYGDTIYTSGTGYIEIWGGTFSAEGPAGTQNEYCVLNKQDGSASEIVVVGGSFVGFNPANNFSEGAGTNFVEVGYCSREADGVWTVVKGHIDGNPVRENENAATCYAEGSYEEVVYCSVCDAELSRTTKPIEKVAHTAGNPVVENEVPATCTAEGSYDSVVYCSVCDAELSRTSNTIAKVAHTAGEPVVENEVPATCTAEGSYDSVVYCSVCDAEMSRTSNTIAKVAHTAGEAVVENEVPATCTADGSYDSVVYCAICETELSRNTVPVTAKGHRFSKVVTTPATCTEDGYITITCGNCNETFVSGVHAEADQYLIDHPYFNLAAKGHTAGEPVTENEKAATCYAEGSYDSVVYCSVCDAEMSRTTKPIEKVAHTAGNPVRENENAATCYAEGSYDKVVYCSVEKCHAELSRTSETIDKVAHTAGNPVNENVKPKTCTTDGSYDEVVYCSVCDAELNRKNVVVPAGHEYVHGGFEHERQCTVCGDLCEGFHNGSLYVEGWLQQAYHLVEYKGAVYFVGDAHKIVKDTKVYLSEKHLENSESISLIGRALEPGYYEFAADGKMVIPAAPEVKHGDVNGYLYNNGVMYKAYQLVEFEGDHYFINDGHKIAKDAKLYLNAQFLKDTEYANHVGWYEFDAQGKLVKAPEWRNGVHNGYLYIDNVMQTAYKLVEFDNHVYFVYDGHKVAANTRLYLTQQFVEGKTFNGEPITVGWYEFDANGWMIIE